MRIILTLIAVTLVVALSAALLVPFFVDWSLHRAQIEAELSDIVGARVVVSGPIDIRFLPVPYLQLRDVKIADAKGGATVFTCENVRLEAALASLPSGRARFTLARLDHPVLTLSRAPDGSLLFPQWSVKAQADRVALDRIVVTGGRLRLVGGGAPLEISGLDLDAVASSLVGPYRGSGRVSTPGGGQAEFHLATAAFTDSNLPIKLEIDPAADLPSGVFDGSLAVAPRAPRGGFDVTYSGSATFSGSSALTEAGPPSPWRVSGTVDADLGAATMKDLVVRFGPDERALEASGAARLDFGAGASLSADLTAKELNIDALLREKGEDSVSPARALGALARVLSSLKAQGGSPLALRIAFTTPTIIVGAQTLTDVALDAKAAAGAPIEGDLAMGVPGQSTLRLSGALELGSAAEFKGRLDARLGDFAQLRAWATADEPEFAQRLTALEEALPYREASATGDVEISAVGFSARNLHLVVDRTALSGAMAFTRPLGNERGRLFMDLRGDALDVDSLPNLSASVDFLGDIDLSLALDATTLRVARVGEATVDGGSLSLKLTKTGNDLSLDHLTIAGLGGAAVELHGASGPQGRWLTLQLNAEKLRDFAALVARVAPGELSRALVQRADALSPAKATFEARSSSPGAIGGLALDSIKAQGSAGQSQFTLKVERSGAAAGGIAATFALEAPEAAALLRQVGLNARSVASGGARIEASAEGRSENGFDTHVAASIAGANFAWRGRIRPDVKGDDDARLFGAASLKADNATPLLAALGLGSPVATAIVPVDLTGDLVLRGAQLGLPRLAGTIAGSKITGRLTWRPPPVEPVAASSIDPDVALAQSIAGEAPVAPTAQIDGEISIDHASLAGLLSLPLGAPQPATPGKWSGAKFAPPLISPPPLDVQMRIGALEVIDGEQARDVTGRLKIDRGRFDFDDFAMGIGGGRASGSVTLRRDGAVATLSGQTSLDVAAIDRAGMRGRFGASLAFASTGQSPSALVAGLVGEGQVQTAGAVIPRLDPGALGRVLANDQTPDARIDETNVVHALGIELDKQPMSLPDGTVPAVMNAGVVRAGPLTIGRKDGQAVVSLDYDLRSQDLTTRATFTEATGGKFWSGPPPSVAVAVAASVDAPTRQIEASSFVAGLAAQTIARESDRIAALEADIRERAFFNRRLKAEQYMRQREAELAAFEADQARIKSERDRKRVEDELLRASEARDKAAAPPVVTPSPRPPQPEIDDSTVDATPSVPTPPKLKPNKPDPTASGLY